MANRKKTKKQVEKVAREVVAGEWGSGRERDIDLTAAGFNPREVQTEVARQRASQ